jgi:hypothetical protein
MNICSGIADNLPVIQSIRNNYAKIIYLIVFTAIFSPKYLTAQDNNAEAPSRKLLALNISSSKILDTVYSANQQISDSEFIAPKPKLLPDKMSFAERGLWGEHGIMRSIGLASPLTPEARRSELQARRTMLTIHQIGGFTTLALMVATCYFGQQTLNGNKNDASKHNMFIALTIGSYSITGLLAVLAPPPMIRRDDETSTTTIHKTLAWFHFAGMIITPILGSLIGGNRHLSAHIDKAHYHQYAGYITTAIFAASMIVVTF